MGDVHEAVKNLVERLHEAARDNLESIILYGSAARGDFHDAHSDLNILCILRSPCAAELARVSAVVKWWITVHHQPAPLFFGADELRQSADVFAIELLDMQQSHRVLYGADRHYRSDELASRSGGARVAHAVAEVAAASSARGGKSAGAGGRFGQIVFEHAYAA